MNRINPFLSLVMVFRHSKRNLDWDRDAETAATCPGLSCGMIKPGTGQCVTLNKVLEARETVRDDEKEQKLAVRRDTAAPGGQAGEACSSWDTGERTHGDCVIRGNGWQNDMVPQA